ISNQAEVHFPSAKEVTPTNIVASKINGLSADNKRVTVNIGTSTTISLSGREVTGKKPTFKILTYPRFGSIKPNLLDVVYTAPDNTGSDIFTYTAVVSGVESSPATVSIEIKGTDVTPPSIVKTYPEDNAENIRFNTQPNPDNTYLPEIWVLFDEELSTNTIGTYNFYIMESGTEIISADVRYDPVSRRVFIRPLSELKPATEYVVNVMNVSDRAGNMLENLYKFKFTTVAKRTLRLSLSDNASELDFYEVLINTKAENKTVGLSSIGISAVNITEVKLSQTGEEFSIVEDKCSQRLLEVDTDCHITIGFAPNTVGNKSATLMITSDDDKNSSLTVRLKGKAIGQQINDDAGTDATTSQDGTNVTTEAKDNGGCGCNYIE
ncbi:MAG: Ig-like domain-containing protein, partial [Myxococcota bacterium]